MYAFLCNQSSLEALRHLGDDAFGLPRWPQTPRRLPRWGDCISKQRELKTYRQEVDLPSYGVASIPVHLLVPEASSRSHGKQALFHVWKHPIPSCSLLRLENTLFASTPAFVILQMASYNQKSGPIIDQFVEELHDAQQIQVMTGNPKPPPYDNPFEWSRKERLIQIALVASEFAGTYRLPVADKDTTYQLTPFMTLDDVRNLADTVPHLYGYTRVQTALGFAFERSASPMETALALMLTLPVEFGGYGLPRPTLNEQLPTGPFTTLWEGGSHITPDLLWKAAMLVIEYESDEFHGSQGPAKATDDATRANVLSAMGYSVLRATPGNVRSQIELDRLARQVAAKLGVGLAEPDDLTLIRRHKLHATLMRQ